MTEVKDFSWCVCLLGCRVACLFLFVCCKSEKNTAGSGNTANNFLQISQYLFELRILDMLFFLLCDVVFIAFRLAMSSSTKEDGRGGAEAYL